MNILLIHPFTRKGKQAIIPFGITYLAAVLKNCDHTVKILDFNLKQISTEKEIKKEIQELEFDIVGIGGIVTAYAQLNIIVKIVKQKDKGVPVMVGGTLGSSIPELLFKNENIDLVALGEGEHIIDPVVRNLISGNYKELTRIPGIVFRNNGAVVYTEKPTRINSIDELPFPAYDLLDMEKYIKNSAGSTKYVPTDKKKGKDVRGFTIITGRGCPYRCTFCYNTFGNKCVKHSVDNTIRHIRFLKDEYGINLFDITDELFILKKSWILEFTRRLIEEDIQIWYRFWGRADIMDEDIYRYLKDSGCVFISYGFESGSDRMLKRMKKGIKVEKYFQAMTLSQKYGITTCPTYVIGMPGENRRSLLETALLIYKTAYFKIPCGLFFATAYPGSELYRHALEKKHITDEHKYLNSISNKDAIKLTINFTHLPSFELSVWITAMGWLHELGYAIHRGQFVLFFKTLIKIFFGSIIKSFIKITRLPMNRKSVLKEGLR